MKWEKAGKVAAESLAFGKTLIIKGASVKEICEKVDEKISSLGAIPAFPTQIALDHIAAHFCPNEEDIILENQVVKLDCGACVDGAIGDTACTVDLSGKHQDMINAVETALEKAIQIIKPGLQIREIGEVLSNEAQKRGFRPIVNLSGHGLSEWRVHTDPTIPNFDNNDTHTLEEGMIFAIEPFFTNGIGRVHNSGNSTLFSEVQEKPIRSQSDRQVLNQIKTFKKLPFTTRWLTKTLPAFKVNMALKNLERNGNLESHPPLADEGKGIVVQAEHTIKVTKDGCEILTKLS